MESFLEDSCSLGEILKQLTKTNSGQKQTPRACFNGEFVIHLVPPNTYHPLAHVAGKSSKDFFIASKIIKQDKEKVFGGFEEDLSSDENVLREEQKPIVQDFENIEIERVPVGIPISQNVVQILECKPLHTPGIKKDRYALHEGLHPLNIQKARYLLSLYIHSLKTDLHYFEWPSLWVLCDGASPQNVVYMASVPDAKLFNVRNVVVNCKGPVTEKEKLPSLEIFLSQHRGTKQQQIPVQTHGYALYEVFGPGSVMSESIQEGQSSIFVEFAWDGVDRVLQCPPHPCDSVLHVKTVPGSLKLATQNLFLELQRLVFLANARDEEKSEISWLPQGDNSVSSVPVVHNVEKFLEELNSGALRVTKNDDDEEDIELGTPISRFTFKNLRKDFDFTEELWLFLKDASNESDYVSALKAIVMALLEGSCQAVIHSGNQTALAKIIREIMCIESVQEKLRIKQSFENMLQEESALKLLMEVGVEKIRRDYTNYFMEEELVTLSQLSYYLESSCSMPDAVSRLQKLYCMLEMVITLKLVLNMGHENLRVLVETALTYYKTHCASTHPLFSMSLPAFGSSSVAAMKQTCSNSLPSVWCLALSNTAAKTSCKTSVIQLSNTHPVTGNMCDIPDASELMSEVVGNKETFSYYLTHAEHSVMKLVKGKTN